MSHEREQISGYELIGLIKHIKSFLNKISCPYTRYAMEESFVKRLWKDYELNWISPYDDLSLDTVLFMMDLKSEATE